MFTVRVFVCGRWLSETFLTQVEALDARARWLDAGFARVQILGLPEVVEGRCGESLAGHEDELLLIVEP